MTLQLRLCTLVSNSSLEDVCIALLLARETTQSEIPIQMFSCVPCSILERQNTQPKRRKTISSKESGVRSMYVQCVVVCCRLLMNDDSEYMCIINISCAYIMYVMYMIGV